MTAFCEYLITERQIAQMDGLGIPVEYLGKMLQEFTEPEVIRYVRGSLDPEGGFEEAAGNMLLLM